MHGSMCLNLLSFVYDDNFTASTPSSLILSVLWNIVAHMFPSFTACGEEVEGKVSWQLIPEQRFARCNLIRHQLCTLTLPLKLEVCSQPLLFFHFFFLFSYHPPLHVYHPFVFPRSLSAPFFFGIS